MSKTKATVVSALFPIHSRILVLPLTYTGFHHYVGINRHKMTTV